MLVKSLLLIFRWVFAPYQADQNSLLRLPPWEGKQEWMMLCPSLHALTRHFYTIEKPTAQHQPEEKPQALTAPNRGLFLNLWGFRLTVSTGSNYYNLCGVRADFYALSVVGAWPGGYSQISHSRGLALPKSDRGDTIFLLPRFFLLGGRKPNGFQGGFSWKKDRMVFLPWLDMGSP